MAILLTGGAGYIGSHTAVTFIGAGVEVIIADNFYNSSPKVLDRIATAFRRENPKSPAYLRTSLLPMTLPKF